jgi:hypothetical protein
LQAANGPWNQRWTHRRRRKHIWQFATW